VYSSNLASAEKIITLEDQEEEEIEDKNDNFKIRFLK
jgi:hypothetical protein